MALFEKGHTRTGGRAKGTRNRLSSAFIEALAKEFEQYGEEAIRICRVEKPVEFLRMIAGILPKEFEILDSRLKEIPDDELDALIELARRRLAASVPGNAASGKESALN